MKNYLLLILLANRSDANTTAKAFEVADILLKDKFIKESHDKETDKAKPNNLSTREKFSSGQLPEETNLEKYTGNFYSEELDATYQIFTENEKLKPKIANYETQQMIISDYDTFATGFGLLRFCRLNGSIKGFELDAGRVTNLKFERK